jgi:hypothetical protein
MRHFTDTINDLKDMTDYAKTLEAQNEKLREALEVAKNYLDLSLGSPAYEGPNPYPLIDAALAQTH